MLSVVTEDDSKRAAIIELGVSETGLSEAILEKDLWVCYLLDYLFHRSEFKGSIIFKGGTSLSKAFGLIERFSEDVDLILDWRLIGYGLNEPWEERSNTKQDKFKLETIERTDDYLANAFVPSLKAGLSEELGIEADVRMGDAEETVLFAYPRLFSSEATLDAVKLEIGPLAAWTPSQPATITSYLAELHPQLFASPSTVVATAAPERTFWEKATVLHQEANRPEGKAMPRRYARHYYDMHKLGHSRSLAGGVCSSGRPSRAPPSCSRTGCARLRVVAARRNSRRACPCSRTPCQTAAPSGPRDSRRRRQRRGSRAGPLLGPSA